jgi:hypothetical protein
MVRPFTVEDDPRLQQTNDTEWFGGPAYTEEAINRLVSIILSEEDLEGRDGNPDRLRYDPRKGF